MKAPFYVPFFVLALAATADEVPYHLSICGENPTSIEGAAQESQTVGFMKQVDGEVWVLRRSSEGAVERVDAEVGMDLFSLDAVETGPNGAFGAIFTDNSTVSGMADTCVEISRYLYQPNARKADFKMRLGRGVVSIKAGEVARIKGDAMSVRVRNDTNLAVTGTRIVIRAD